MRRCRSRSPTLLGSLGGIGGIAAGLRQLRRTRPLAVVEVDVAGAGPLRVPTRDEVLRIKAYLVVQRNQVRDHLDVVALTAAIGADEAVPVLLGIDDYYTDRSEDRDFVLTAVTERLSLPDPRDHHVTTQPPGIQGPGRPLAGLVRGVPSLPAPGRPSAAGPGTAAVNPAFRNVVVPDRVQDWPYEAFVTAIERGTIGDWAVLTRAVAADPWGELSRQVEATSSMPTRLPWPRCCAAGSSVPASTSRPTTGSRSPLAFARQ